MYMYCIIVCVSVGIEYLLIRKTDVHVCTAMLYIVILHLYQVCSLEKGRWEGGRRERERERERGREKMMRKGERERKRKRGKGRGKERENATLYNCTFCYDCYIDQFGVLESVKAAADVYCPLNGTVVQVNTELEESPELINTDTYGEGIHNKKKANSN